MIGASLFWVILGWACVLYFIRALPKLKDLFLFTSLCLCILKVLTEPRSRSYRCLPVLSMWVLGTELRPLGEQ